MSNDPSIFTPANGWGNAIGFGMNSCVAPVPLIREQLAGLASYSDECLRSKAATLIEGAERSRLGAKRSIWRRRVLDSAEVLLPLTLVAEAARRTLGLQMYDCQLLAAWTTASGRMIEMQTGEGKTLVCGAAAATCALSGRTTHVATTNAYLASRDFETMRPLFDFLGLTSASLPEEYSPPESRAAYQRQIVYGPGYQFGFDYLADQMTRQRFTNGKLGADTLSRLHGFDLTDELIQTSNFDTTIIDEADSVLIDEALTPLILSGQSNSKVDPAPFRAAQRFCELLVEDQDFLFDRSQSQVNLTREGQAKSDQFRKGLTNVRLHRNWKTYVTNALRANLGMHRNVDYVVDDGQVKIVDQLTGRIFDDRSWQAGLHQAVEVKEQVELTPPRESQVRITRQSFIGKYQRLCGMSGTIQDTADELKQTYDVTVVSIPTHHLCQRKRLPTRFFECWAAKAEAIAREVRERHARGQPILIGTASIEKSLTVAEAVEAAGLTAVVLNGLQDQAEAEIVAGAGQTGQITIATNMAGRGTDIKLSKESRQYGGLHVIGTEPNACRRVDRQLVGRAARQGDPGSSQFFISADDDLIAKRSPELSRQITRACRDKQEASHDFTVAVTALQRLEERLQVEIRRRMVANERWLNLARQTVFGK